MALTHAKGVAMATSQQNKEYILRCIDGLPADKVQEAIDFLVAKGWLVMREIADSKKIYGVERDRMGEIKEFLAGPERKAKAINHKL